MLKWLHGLAEAAAAVGLVTVAVAVDSEVVLTSKRKKGHQTMHKLGLPMNSLARKCSTRTENPTKAVRGNAPRTPADGTAIM
jgi:hypothetical protein